MLVFDYEVVNEVVLRDPKTGQMSKWSAVDALDSAKKAIATLQKIQNGKTVNSQVAVDRVSMFVHIPVERLMIHISQNYKFQFPSALTPEQTINLSRKQQRWQQRQRDAVA